MYEVPSECARGASESSTETCAVSLVLASLLASAISEAGSSLKRAVSPERVCAPCATKVRTQMKSQAKI